MKPFRTIRKRYAVLDGRELIEVFDSQDSALACAHFYEQCQATVYNRLCICDIMPISYGVLVANDNQQ